MVNYKWIAHYTDNTKLEQIPGKSQYPLIDRTKLKSFEIINGDTDKSILNVELQKNQRLIYRTMVVNQMAGMKIIGITRIPMVGWQQTIKGENIQCIYYIGQDGTIHQSGKFIHPVSLRDDELTTFE